MTGRTWFTVATLFFGGMSLYYLYIAFFTSLPDTKGYLSIAIVGLIVTYYTNQIRKNIDTE